MALLVPGQSLSKPLSLFNMAIKILSQDVINQIAAGEVIERPAHLIKELVENSLDAKATQIIIEVSQGGREILIHDNGIGIEGEDIELSLERHSTSKINQADDLWSLESYGFRGEALASIAAVSHLTISSRTESMELGVCLKTEFGKVISRSEVGLPKGTQIKVSQLFSNLPARLKFLKSDSAEIGQIRQVIRAMALVNPQVEWRFLVESRLDLYFPIEDEPTRCSQVLDLDTCYQGYAQLGSYQAQIFMADPHETVKSNKSIWIFVQGRWVQDRALSAAVMEGFRNILMHHEYPQIYVKLWGDPSSIDVNIHPTKSQVKFEKPSDAFRVIVHGIRQGLEKRDWLAKDSSLLKEDTFLKQESSFEDKALSQESFNRGEIKESHLFQKSDQNKKYFSQVTQSQFEEPSFLKTQFKQKNKSEPDFPNLKVEELTYEGEKRKTQLSQYLFSTENENKNKAFENSKENLFSADEFSSPSLETSNAESIGRGALASSASEVISTYWQNHQVLGQAGLTYIICQNQQGLVLIDQHAAHERVWFERIQRSFRKGIIIWQDLLFPIVIDLNQEKKEIVMTQKERLLTCGLNIEEMGPQSLAIVSHADWIYQPQIPVLLDQLATEILDQGESFIFEKWQSEKFSSQACHKAIRAGQALSHEEMVTLLKEMDEFPLSSFCPHGRPVSVSYSFYELEKDFGRIVT